MLQLSISDEPGSTPGVLCCDVSSADGERERERESHSFRFFDLFNNHKNEQENCETTISALRASVFLTKFSYSDEIEMAD